MKIGNTDIEKIYLGAEEVEKVYLGGSEVYEETGSTPTPSSYMLKCVNLGNHFGFNVWSGETCISIIYGYPTYDEETETSGYLVEEFPQVGDTPYFTLTLVDDYNGFILEITGPVQNCLWAYSGEYCQQTLVNINWSASTITLDLTSIDTGCNICINGGWEDAGYESEEDCLCQAYGYSCPEDPGVDCDNWEEMGYESYEDCQCQEYGDCGEEEPEE